jgi:hypothetical protein
VFGILLAISIPDTSYSINVVDRPDEARTVTNALTNAKGEKVTTTQAYDKA